MKHIRLITSVYVNGKLQTIAEQRKLTDLILADLEDVVLDVPAVGDVLTYDGTDWVNLPGSGNSFTEDGIEALGANQAGATALSARFSFIDTIGANNRGVKFPAAIKNREYTAQNDHATNDMLVYPALGEAFYGLAANAPIPVVAGNKIHVVCATAGTWRVN